MLIYSTAVLSFLYYGEKNDETNENNAIFNKMRKKISREDGMEEWGVTVTGEF